MQNSAGTEQVFELSDMENVWLNKVNEDVWAYRIAANPKYLSKSKLKLFMSILLCFGLIGAGILVWSLTTALFGALVAIFILPLLEVITVLAYTIVLVGKKEEVITINRTEGTISTRRRHWRGSEENTDFRLQEFHTARCSGIAIEDEKSKGNSSMYFVVSLHGHSSDFEILCARDKEAVRIHCRELAEFLNLKMRDEIPSATVSTIYKNMS